MRRTVLNLARPDARSGRARSAAPVQPGWTYEPVRPAGAPEQTEANRQKKKQSNSDLASGITDQSARMTTVTPADAPSNLFVCNFEHPGRVQMYPNSHCLCHGLVPPKMTVLNLKSSSRLGGSKYCDILVTVLAQFMMWSHFFLASGTV